MNTADKRADLAGPGISTYAEVAKILPSGYRSLLTPLETMKALFAVKGFIEEGLSRELNLQMVQVPLIVTRESGVNDMLDRDGSRTPVEFPCGLGLPRPLNAQVVQAATKWKRPALAQFGCQVAGFLVWAPLQQLDQGYDACGRLVHVANIIHRNMSEHDIF